MFKSQGLAHSQWPHWNLYYASPGAFSGSGEIFPLENPLLKVPLTLHMSILSVALSFLCWWNRRQRKELPHCWGQLPLLITRKLDCWYRVQTGKSVSGIRGFTGASVGALLPGVMVNRWQSRSNKKQGNKGSDPSRIRAWIGLLFFYRWVVRVLYMFWIHVLYQIHDL